MSEIKMKNPPPLVQAVFSLDGHFNDLLRLGAKIESLEMKSSFDFEQTQRHLDLFAKAAQGVSDEVIAMSEALMDVRARAEAITKIVAERAEALGARQALVQTKMQAFAQLGAEVGELNQDLMQFSRPEGAELTEEDRDRLQSRLGEFEPKIRALIEKARAMKDDAREAKIKELEQSAESLTQRLTVIGEKIAFAPKH